MLLRNTLLYLPAQVVGPLFQLISVVVWTHIVGESPLGIVTLVTATHELLQTVFLYWWSMRCGSSERSGWRGGAPLLPD